MSSGSGTWDSALYNLFMNESRRPINEAGSDQGYGSGNVYGGSSGGSGTWNSAFYNLFMNERQRPINDAGTDQGYGSGTNKENVYGSSGGSFRPTSSFGDFLDSFFKNNNEDLRGNNFNMGTKTNVYGFRPINT